MVGRPTVSSGRHIVLLGQDVAEVDLGLLHNALHVTHELPPGGDLELGANVPKEAAERLRVCLDGGQHI